MKLSDYKPQTEEERIDTLRTPIAKTAREYLIEQYPIEHVAMPHKEVEDLIIQAVTLYLFIGSNHVTSGGDPLAASELALAALIEVIDEHVVGIINYD